MAHYDSKNKRQWKRDSIGLRLGYICKIKRTDVELVCYVCI